jgi:hypothetical protein
MLLTRVVAASTANGENAMNVFTKILAATALLASTSTAALAQAQVDVGVGAGGNAGVEAGNGNGNAGGSTAVGIDGNANASANANANRGGQADVSTYGDVISSLRTSTVTPEDIEGLAVDTAVTVVVLSELRGNAAENASALDQALAAQETSIDELRPSLEARAEVQAALEAEGFTTDDVVAVSLQADGSLTVIVDASA